MKKKMIFLILLIGNTAAAQLNISVNSQQYYVIPDQLLGVNTPLYPDFLTPAPPCIKCEKSNTGNPCMNVASIPCNESGSCEGSWRTDLPSQLETDADALHYRAMYYPEGVVSRYYHYVSGGKGFCINPDEADYINLWGLNSGKANPEPRKRYCNENSYNYTNFFEKNIQLCRNEAVPSESMHMVISANVYFGTWHELKYILEYCEANNVTVDAIVFGTEIEHDQDNVPSKILSDGDTIPFASGGSYFKHVQHVFIDSIKLDPLYAELPLHFSTGIQHGGQGGCANRTYFCDDTLGKKSLWNRQIHDAIEVYNQTHNRQLAFAGAVNWWWFPVNNDTLNLSATLAANDMNEFFEQGVTANGHPLCYKYPGGVASGEFSGFDEILVVQWGVKKFNGTCNGTTYENRFITQVFILKRILNMLENNFNIEFNPAASNGIRYTNAFYHRLGSNNGYNPLDFNPDNGAWTTENISNYAIRQINSVSGHKFRRAEITNGPAKNCEAYYIFNCSEQKLFLINYSDTTLTINNLMVDSVSFTDTSLFNYQETSVAANSLRGILAPLSETNQNVQHEQVVLENIIVPAYGILIIDLPFLTSAASQEVCNGIDDDCDTEIDEVQALYFADEDSDGYGNPNAGMLLSVCSTPAGYVADSSDCVDDPVSGKTIHPGAAEVCNGLDENCNGAIDENVLNIFYEDTDGDLFGNPMLTIVACTAPPGFVSDNSDCDDSAPAFHPGAPEICNEVDDNCNSSIDEGVQLTFYADEDGDNYGVENTTTVGCFNPPGYVSSNGDCNDDPVTGSTIHPEANEVCNGLDDNCNTAIDEGVQLVYYADEDQDSYGNPFMSALACSVPAGYVENPDDCDDSPVTGAAVNPQGIEICNAVDDNCNSIIDDNLQSTFYADEDGDSYGNSSITAIACSAPPGFTSDNSDCDDNTVSGGMIYPGAIEMCNNIDDNCNTVIDENLQITFYEDADGDTYGDASVTAFACSVPPGFSPNADDCDDSPLFGGLIYPGAAEVCNGMDDNCDFSIDEGVLLLFYQDADGDQYGNSTTTTLACSLPPGFVDNNTDCDDNPVSGTLIHPGATESCNGIDDNCNTAIDEGVLVKFYADADGDSYGTASINVLSCAAPSGFVSDSTDCNDSLANIHPAMTEICNGIDDNCNALIDEEVKSSFFADADGDTYGDEANSFMACTAPPGFVTDNGDCDDSPLTGVNIHPSATEVCNALDDDCNGLIDETVQSMFYLDADGDAYGNFEAIIFACSAPAGYVDNNEDCNDDPISGPLIHPGATEVCNNADDNCNGNIDEDVQSIYYADADGDGFGTVSFFMFACSPQEGYVADGSDCDDSPSTGSAIHPSASEICNGIDDNCNAITDEGVQLIFYEDADNDLFGNAAISTLACAAPLGYVTDDLDCNDSPLIGSAIHPGASEVCNGTDDDCDGSIDENVQLMVYPDEDGDSFGDPSSGVLACF
ncbi:MAG: putative metal-binding motif-containing protein, partial [Chitinophagales bacterium]